MTPWTVSRELLLRSTERCLLRCSAGAQRRPCEPRGSAERENGEIFRKASTVSAFAGNLLPLSLLFSVPYVSRESEMRERAKTLSMDHMLTPGSSVPRKRSFANP